MAQAPVRPDAEDTRYDLATRRGDIPIQNTANPLHRDTADQFNEQHYNSVQSRDESRGIRNSSTEKRVVGTTMQVGGIAMKMGGKATKQAGRVMARAGTALSATGVGAIVGVPLAIAGGGLSAVGSGAETAGKMTSKTGRALKRQAKLGSKKKIGAVKNVVGSAILSALVIKTWIMVLVPSSILSIIFLATVIGIPFFLFFLGLNWVATFILIFAVLARHASMGISPIAGQNSDVKILILCGCVVGHLIPLINLVPWILFYIWYTALYPR